MPRARSLCSPPPSPRHYFGSWGISPTCLPLPGAIAAGARAGPGELGAGLCHWCARWDKGVTNLLGGASAAGSFTLWYKLYVCIRPEGNGDMWH